MWSNGFQHAIELRQHAQTGLVMLTALPALAAMVAALFMLEAGLASAALAALAALVGGGILWRECSAAAPGFVQRAVLGSDDRWQLSCTAAPPEEARLLHSWYLPGVNIIALGWITASGRRRHLLAGRSSIPAAQQRRLRVRLRFPQAAAGDPDTLRRGQRQTAGRQR